MKKNLNILIGIFSPLFYYLVVNIMLYCLLFEYNEQYAILKNAMYLILPALPGVVMTFLLVRNSLKDFFKSLGICFLVSAFIILIYHYYRIDLKIYTFMTGYDEFSLGEGFIFAIMSISYYVSCLVGTVISGVITLLRRNRIS